LFSSKNEDIIRDYDLTFDELRSFPVFEQLTDEQLAEAIATIKQFTLIIYNFYQKNRKDPLNEA